MNRLPVVLLLVSLSASTSVWAATQGPEISYFTNVRDIRAAQPGVQNSLWWTEKSGAGLVLTWGTCEFMMAKGRYSSAQRTTRRHLRKRRTSKDP